MRDNSKVKKQEVPKSLKTDSPILDLNNAEIKAELVKEGGKHKVPCLRIEEQGENVRWLYSSNAICLFLQKELSL